MMIYGGFKESSKNLLTLELLFSLCLVTCMGFVEKRAVKITRDLKGVLMSITGVPTTVTAYGHGFDKVPGHVIIIHTDYGITGSVVIVYTSPGVTGLVLVGGIVREIRASRNTSSISLAANISGVGVDVLVIP